MYSACLPASSTAWIAAWFLIFIIHEMGHALVIQRVFGANPWIILYGFGGAAIHQPYYKRIPGNGGRMLISFAGPGAALGAGVPSGRAGAAPVADAAAAVAAAAVWASRAAVA